MSDRLILGVVLAGCAFMVAWGILGLVLYWGTAWMVAGFCFIAWGLWSAFRLAVEW